MLGTPAAYCHKRTLELTFASALEKTREALAAEGFGILTEIDVTATFQKKLQTGFRPYTILGACNPPLAYRALSTELDVGVLLPCNVAVYEGDSPQESVVAVVDPEVSIGRADIPELAPVAAEVKAKLERVLAAIR